MKYLGILSAFLVSLFFHLYRLGHFELQGDEASGLLTALKMSLSLDAPKMMGHIFLFGHTPLRVLLNFFAIFSSHYSEFVLRFPNALAGALSLFPFHFIALKMASNFSAILMTFCFATLGLCFGNRLAMGVGPYVLFQLSALYFLLKFCEKNNSKDLYYFSLMIFLAIMTYAEGAIFFIPFLLILLLYKINIWDFVKRFYKTLIIFLLFFLPFLSLWFFIPYYLFQKGLIPDFRVIGGFRIMARATSGLSNHIVHNFNMMESYVGLIPHLFFIFTFFLFLFLKLKKGLKREKAIFIWFFIPAFYFHFMVSDPTNHMQFYYSYLVLLAASCFDYFSKKIRVVLFSVIMLFSISHSFKISQEKRRLDWGPQITLGLRPLGGFVRKNIPSHHLMYLEGVEGYVARVYFSLSYTEDKNKADLLITNKKNESYQKPWVLVAQSCALNIWAKKEIPLEIFNCSKEEGMAPFYSRKKMLAGFLAKNH